MAVPTGSLKSPLPTLMLFVRLVFGVWRSAVVPGHEGAELSGH